MKRSELAISFNQQVVYTFECNNGVAQRTMTFGEARKQTNTRESALASSDLAQKILRKLHTAWALWDHLTLYILFQKASSCTHASVFSCVSSWKFTHTLYNNYIYFCISLINCLRGSLLHQQQEHLTMKTTVDHKLQASVVVHPDVNRPWGYPVGS